MQADVLDRRPHNGETTGLRGEHVDLISPLSHIAEEAFDGIGGLNVSMHRLRKRKKRERILFVLSQTSHRFWIALAVFGFEGRQLDHCHLLARLIPDAHEFGLHIASLSPGNGIEDIALLMH
jgi:hypothetical protein